jgi:hypothetical protein
MDIFVLPAIAGMVEHLIKNNSEIFDLVAYD